MRAFGPYPGEQVLNFRELGDRSFFLIHGPTGSGKSTILDAICYALYGDTSGGDRDGREMRSHLAEPGDLTEVTFDFALGGEAYRVTRRPEQERPRRRGGGTTLEPAQATLWRRTGLVGDDLEGTVLESQARRVTARVEELTGFRSDQFRQVVLLPQGQFQRLLRADSRERQGILETLFETETFRRIEEALKEAARGVTEAVREMERRRGLILEQAGAERPEELLARRAEAAGRLGEARRQREAWLREEARAREELAAAVQVVERFQERDRAGEALAALEGQQDDYRVRRRVLERAQKAAPLADLEAQVAQRGREAGEAEAVLAGAVAALEAARVAREAAAAALAREEAREGEARVARGRLDYLEGLADRVAGLEAARRSLTAALEAAAGTGVARAEARAALAGCQELLEGRRQALDKARGEAARTEALELAAREAAQALERGRRLEGARLGLGRAEGAHGEALRRLREADASLEAARAYQEGLERDWLAGQAAVLARGLVPGEPCAVCGSTHHPAPVLAGDELPGQAGLEAARGAVQVAEADRDAARTAETERQGVLLRCQAEVAALEDSLREGTSPALTDLTDLADLAALDVRARELEAALGAAAEAGRQARALEAEIRQLEEREALARAALEGAEEALRVATAGLERARAVAGERQGDIPEELRDAAALGKAREEAWARVEACREALEAARRQAGAAGEVLAGREAEERSARKVAVLARERAEEQVREFTARLRAAGFAGADDYRGACLAVGEMTALQAEIEGYEAGLTAARQRLDRARAAVADLAMPDLEALREAAVAAVDAVAGAAAEAAALETQMKQMDGWLEGLDRAAAELAALGVRYTVVGRLAEVAGGRNPHGVTFQRFVLATLLDDVLMAASRRLRLMSRGRYDLRRATARADQRQAGGLDLEVYDGNTGTTRSVATLSGGESFLASLALALGLADVVQSFAGGIHLETIFVDEGFGTLDPEALDLALGALVDLQRGGRLVGIISHVPELKERIDARLEVTAARGGSTARFVMS